MVYKKKENGKEKNMNSIANWKLISNFDKRGTIFHLCYAFAIAYGLYIYIVQVEDGWHIEICHVLSDSTVLKQ